MVIWDVALWGWIGCQLRVGKLILFLLFKELPEPKGFFLNKGLNLCRRLRLGLLSCLDLILILIRVLLRLVSIGLG